MGSGRPVVDILRGMLLDKDLTWEVDYLAAMVTGIDRYLDLLEGCLGEGKEHLAEEAGDLVVRIRRELGTLEVRDG